MTIYGPGVKWHSGSEVSMYPDSILLKKKEKKKEIKYRNCEGDE